MLPQNILLISPINILLLTGLSSIATNTALLKQDQSFYLIPQTKKDITLPPLSKNTTSSLSVIHNNALPSLLQQTSDQHPLFYESTLPHWMHQALFSSTGSAQSIPFKQAYLLPYEIPMKDPWVTQNTSLYLLAEASLIYAYSLLSEGLSQKELLSEIAQYLILNDISPNNLCLEVLFYPYPSSNKKTYQTLQSNSWIVFRIRFFKNHLQTQLVKTVHYHPPSASRQKRYNQAKDLFQMYKKQMMNHASSFPLSHLSKRSNLSIPKIPKGTQVHLRPLNDPTIPPHNLLHQTTFIPKEQVPYLLSLIMSTDTQTIEMSDILILQKQKWICYNTFGDDLLVF